MENIIMLILGVLISVVGIVNIKGNISTIHSYNRRRVKEEDIPKYGKVVGTGTLIIGISLVLGFIVSFWSEEIMGYIILTATIIGLGLILYGQFKFSAFPFVMRSALNAKKSLWLQRQFGNMCCSPTKCCTLQTSGIILYRLSSRSRKKEPALGL